MAESTGQSILPDRITMDPRDDPNYHPTQDAVVNFSSDVYRQIRLAFNDALTFALIYFIAGILFDSILSRPFNKHLRPETPGRFKITRLDFASLAGVWVFLWTLVCFTKPHDQAVNSGIIYCFNWTWLWVLSVYRVCWYKIEDRAARLIVVCLLFPLVRSGFLILLPLAWVLSGFSFHGRSKDELYGPGVLALEVAAIVAIFTLLHVVIRRELSRRELLKSVEISGLVVPKVTPETSAPPETGPV